jgi:hypothetical protein
MLESIGIKAVTIIGNARSLSDFDLLMTEPNRHEWTAFWYEDENRWVFLDSGWDSWNRYGEDGYETREDNPRKYFDITLETLAQTHRAERAEHRDYFGVLSFFDEEEKELSTQTEELVDNQDEETGFDWLLIRIGIGGLLGIIIVVFILSKRAK